MREMFETLLWRDGSAGPHERAVDQSVSIVSDHAWFVVVQHRQLFLYVLAAHSTWFCMGSFPTARGHETPTEMAPHSRCRESIRRFGAPGCLRCEIPGIPLQRRRWRLVVRHCMEILRELDCSLGTVSR